MLPERRRGKGLRSVLTFALIMGIMVVLLLIEVKLALRPPLDRVMQLATVVLTYGLLAIWIHMDPGATIR